MQTTPQKRTMPWDDDPRLGRYIDDNALFMLDAVSRGHLSGKHASYHFFLASAQPLEWDHKMQIKFLLRIADEYGFELNKFSTMTYAFAEEYEESIFDEKIGKQKSFLFESNENLSEFNENFSSKSRIIVEKVDGVISVKNG